MRTQFFLSGYSAYSPGRSSERLVVTMSRLGKVATGRDRRSWCT